MPKAIEKNDAKVIQVGQAVAGLKRNPQAQIVVWNNSYWEPVDFTKMLVLDAMKIAAEGRLGEVIEPLISTLVIDRTTTGDTRINNLGALYPAERDVKYFGVITASKPLWAKLINADTGEIIRYYNKP